MSTPTYPIRCPECDGVVESVEADAHEGIGLDPAWVEVVVEVFARPCGHRVRMKDLVA